MPGGMKRKLEKNRKIFNQVKEIKQSPAKATSDNIHRGVERRKLDGKLEKK